MNKQRGGSVYVLDFEPGLPVTGNRVARHYLGFAERDIDARIAQHLRRQGSPLVAAVIAAGGGVTLERVWTGVDCGFERRLKRRHETPRLCPRCARDGPTAAADPCDRAACDGPLTLAEAELAVIAESIREAIAGELLAPGSRVLAHELLDRIDAKLPPAVDHHPAGPVTGWLLAGDEILRLLLAREERDGHAALTNEQIAADLDWKPAGTSVRALLDDLRRGGWLTHSRAGPQRRFTLTSKGRGRARSLQHAGIAATDGEARISEPDELLDLIYAYSTACTIRWRGDDADHVPGVWHGPTVQAAARLDDARFRALQAVLRDRGMIGTDIHSYGTLMVVGEQHARERWRSSRPPGAFGGPPRLARSYQDAGSVIVRTEDRACPSCGAHASWLVRRRTRRWEELRGRGEAGFSCVRCDVRWIVYLEPTGPSGGFDPLAEPTACRLRWRYRGGWLHGDALAPPDHHPTISQA